MKLLNYDEEDEYLIFLNNIYTNDLDFKDEHKLEKSFKKIVINMKKKYNIDLFGFYEVSVFYNKKIGSLFKIIKIDNYNLYNRNVDLKIIICLNCCFYFKTLDFDIIKNYKNINYYNNEFYINVDDIDDNMINLIEHGEVLFFDKISKIKKSFIKIK